MCSKQQLQQFWFFLSYFSDQFHFKIRILLHASWEISLLLEGCSNMNKVTSVSVDTEVVVFKTSAFLRFVLGVVFIVFSELIEAVGELASFVVRTVAIIHEFFAELGLLLVRFGFGQALPWVESGIGVAFLEGGSAVVLIICCVKDCSFNHDTFLMLVCLLIYYKILWDDL